MIANKGPDQTDTATVNRSDASETVVPLFAEEISVSKRVVAKNVVRISTVTRTDDAVVDELLAREHVEIERTPIGTQIDAMPSIREEGDIIIVPVVEEVLVVKRQLILKEELRIRKVRSTERYQERVQLRKQEAVVTRQPVMRVQSPPRVAQDGEEQSNRSNVINIIKEN